MRRLTASKFGLALACTYPWTSGLKWQESPGYSARLGKAFHRYAELMGQCDVEQLMKDNDLTPALRRRFVKMMHDWLVWSSGMEIHAAHRELKLQIDPEFGDAAIINDPGERNYENAWPGAVTMTADVVQGNVVRDYKTGRWVEHPETNPQMRLLSLAVAKVTGASKIESHIERFTEEEGHVNLHYTHGPEILARTEDELRRVHLKITSGDAVATPGKEHCKFCPVRETCTFKYKENAA